MMTNNLGSQKVYYVCCMSRKCPVNPYTDELKSISDAAYWWNKRADTTENIVHCKDCKNFTDTLCGWCKEFERPITRDDFCSHGKRKELDNGEIHQS